MKDLFGFQIFDIEEWFLTKFWPAYPRRVAKVVAWKTVQKLVQSEKLAETIMEGLMRHRKKWGTVELKYIPHPSTWLNQRRWEDEDSIPFAPARMQSTRDPETQRRLDEAWKQKEQKA